MNTEINQSQIRGFSFRDGTYILLYKRTHVIIGTCIIRNNMCRYLTTSIISEKIVTTISLDNIVEAIIRNLTEIEIISGKKKESCIGNIVNASFDTRFIISFVFSVSHSQTVLVFVSIYFSVVLKRELLKFHGPWKKSLLKKIFS